MLLLGRDEGSNGWRNEYDQIRHNIQHLRMYYETLNIKGRLQDRGGTKAR